ncbi:MAG: methylated-DNA--[protein]-cysteine S-methyltransferase [candidate division Zixibacteria bacterium]|nr:methylated-DNA--[protein]-cysteine S-methyltransferase [candidate division Zixibacteria bacterium]
MIAGASDTGVCFLEWHDRGGVERILKRVEKRYKTTPVLSNVTNPHLIQLEKELTEYFDGRRRVFDVSIDVHGTPFQKIIWDQLMDIPYGETRSYGQLAKLVGKPGGMRAVGRANGSNYLSIIIPCHRVIESSGGLGGYGGKLWRKKRLLELEGSLGESFI